MRKTGNGWMYQISEDTTRRPKPAKVHLDRAELIRLGICVCCQNEPASVEIENVMGRNCRNAFAGADARAAKIRA